MNLNEIGVKLHKTSKELEEVLDPEKEKQLVEELRGKNLVQVFL